MYVKITSIFVFNICLYILQQSFDSRHIK